MPDDIIGAEETPAAPNAEQQKPDATQELLSMFEKLVGEGKPYADAEALAKSKSEGDAFISHLTGENKELRDYTKTLEEELRSLKTKDEIEKIRSEAMQKNQPAQPEANKPAEEKRTDPAELQELIDRRLEERETLSKAQTNINSVNEKLLEIFGGDATKAKEAVSAKIKELGIGSEQLKTLSATSPTGS